VFSINENENDKTITKLKR